MAAVCAAVAVSASGAKAQTLDELAELGPRTQFSKDSFRPGTINPRTNRAVGMGNAQVAVGGSYDSMFYNPAGLASIRNWQFSVLGIRAEANSEAFSFIQDSVDITDSSNPSEVNQFFGDRVGDVIFIGADNITHVVIPYEKWAFGIAYAYTYRVDGFIAGTNSTNYQTAIRKLEDNAGFVTVSRQLWEQYVDVGLSLKFLNRIDIRTSETPASIGANNGTSYDKDFFKPFKGPGDFAAGADAGIIGRLPFSLLGGESLEEPSEWGVRAGYVATGFTFQDVARTRFREQAPDPAKGILATGGGNVPMTVDWGLAAAVPFEIARVTLAFDVRDINRDEIKLGDKYSLGLELAFRHALTIRGGVNANGFAAGAEIRAYAVRLNGEFVQEKNTSVVNPAGSEKENRLSAGISFGWPYK